MIFKCRQEEGRQWLVLEVELEPGEAIDVRARIDMADGSSRAEIQCYELIGGSRKLGLRGHNLLPSSGTFELFIEPEAGSEVDACNIQKGIEATNEEKHP